MHTAISVRISSFLSPDILHSVIQADFLSSRKLKTCWKKWFNFSAVSQRKSNALKIYKSNQVSGRMKGISRGMPLRKLPACTVVIRLVEQLLLVIYANRIGKHLYADDPARGGSLYLWQNSNKSICVNVQTSWNHGWTVASKEFSVKGTIAVM